jgi:transcriptional regulator with XRE-family HTH domain
VRDSLDNPARFVEWVRLRLAARRISIRQLAARAGVDASTISRMLAGEREPSLTTALKVASVLRGAGPGFEQLLGLAVQADPIRAVEAALRSDPALRPADLTRVMAMYIAVREESRSEPAEARRPDSWDGSGAGDRDLHRRHADGARRR